MLKFVCGECGQRYEREGYCTVDGARLDEARDSLLGTDVLRYRLARVIGEGGMGRVYLGVQPAIGGRVAIKVLSESCARDPELVDRFFAEARAVNLIAHENIVNVLDLAKLPDGRPFIIMEFIEGRTLTHAAKGGRAPLGGVVRVFSDVLSALGAAHAIGIIHRDLKPDNVLVTGKGHAKVLDFGIAKLAPHHAGTFAARTVTGALLGTPAYMAPEQIDGAANVDARSDIYAAGAVLFHAVTGRAPFAGATIYDTMRAQLEEQPPSPRSLRPDLPIAFEQVILRALAKDPAQRFATTAEIAAALEDAATLLTEDQWRELSQRAAPIRGRGSAPRITQPPPMRETPPAHSIATPPSTKRRRPWLLAGIGVAAAALAIGGFVIAAREPQSSTATSSSVAVASSSSMPVSTTEVAPSIIDASVALVGADATRPSQVHVDANIIVARTPRIVPSSSPVQQHEPALDPPPPPDAALYTPRAPGEPDKLWEDYQKHMAGEPEDTREEIAKKYNVHVDIVALRTESPTHLRRWHSHKLGDGKAFSLSSGLDHAYRLAELAAPNAQLVEITIHGLDAIGGIYPAGAGKVEYLFHSGIGSGNCKVVSVTAVNRHLETWLPPQGCALGAIPNPKCRISDVWRVAQDRGVGHSRNLVIKYTQLGWDISGGHVVPSMSVFESECGK